MDCVYESLSKGSLCIACGRPLPRTYESPPRRNCQRQEPSLAQKATNFAIASAQHLAAGRPQATNEQVAARFSICQACPLFKPIGEGQGQCTHPSCGCSLKAVGVTGRNKLRWADQKCPIGKWQPVTARTDTA